MAELSDPVGAFMPGPRVTLPGAGSGPLAGLSFGLKDLFDVAGHVSTFGNPDWARTHPPAAATAPCVTMLTEAGAAMVGKTITVELAAGLTGENLWYGMPTNPACPDRVPGGSSCGSAAGVAAELFDFALGSDTAGSVRIPASYCGIYGIRPTWGAVNACGALPLGPSFDTVGWFAREAALLRRVGEVLLPPDPPRALGPLLKVEEAWVNADPAVAAALTPSLERLEARLGRAAQVEVAVEGLHAFFDAFRACNNEENLSSLGPWVYSVKPKLSPVVQARFEQAPHQPPAKSAWARHLRATAGARIRAMLGGGAVMVFPTSPLIPPKRDAGPDEVQQMRERTIGVTSISGFSGAPEISIPAARVSGAPVGLSFMSAPGTDRALLAFVEKAAEILGLP
ncbi:amidase [Elioraea rosea]|uniref:amidase n=1 Tax=Elioraea rosea TaxID=2492390 RepID=UPI001182198F|nr:amidase [Elioraea rosea]